MKDESEVVDLQDESEVVVFRKIQLLWKPMLKGPTKV